MNTQKMNANQRYDYLLNRRREVLKAKRDHDAAVAALVTEQARVQEAYDVEIREFVTARLLRLSSVGWSVMRKSYGNDYDKIKELLQTKNTLDLPSSPLRWLGGFTVKSIHSPYISLGLTIDGKQTGMILDRSFLHMSDRDFAKFVRQTIREHKESERKAANEEAQRKIRAMSRQIKHLEAQLAQAKAEAGN